MTWAHQTFGCRKILADHYFSTLYSLITLDSWSRTCKWLFSMVDRKPEAKRAAQTDSLRGQSMSIHWKRRSLLCPQSDMIRLENAIRHWCSGREGAWQFRFSANILRRDGQMGRVVRSSRPCFTNYPSWIGEKLCCRANPFCCTLKLGIYAWGFRMLGHHTKKPPWELSGQSCLAIAVVHSDSKTSNNLQVPLHYNTGGFFPFSPQEI